MKPRALVASFVLAAIALLPAAAQGQFRKADDSPQSARPPGYPRGGGQLRAPMVRVPHVAPINPGSDHLTYFRRNLAAAGVGANLVTDCHIAALAMEHQAESVEPARGEEHGDVQPLHVHCLQLHFGGPPALRTADVELLVALVVAAAGLVRVAPAGARTTPDVDPHGLPSGWTVRRSRTFADVTPTCA